MYPSLDLHISTGKPGGHHWRSCRERLAYLLAYASADRDGRNGHSGPGDIRSKLRDEVNYLQARSTARFSQEVRFGAFSHHDQPDSGNLPPYQRKDRVEEEAHGMPI